MREQSAAFKLKHKAKLARIAKEARDYQANVDVMAVEKEREIEEKHNQLAKRVRQSTKMMKEVNRAKVAEQAIRRQRLFRSREEELEAQKAETIAHLDEVDQRLRAKQKLVEDRIDRQKKAAVSREMGRAAQFEKKVRFQCESSFPINSNLEFRLENLDFLIKNLHFTIKQEKSMMEVSMQLEEKRAAKEFYMESVAEARERERLHEIEAQKLQFAARVEQVKRLRRAKAFEV